MNGQYRFLRTYQGITSFAFVEVEASTEAGSGVSIEEHLPTSPNRDNGEENRQSVPSWIDAAISGVRDAVEYAQSVGMCLDGWHIRLVKVRGTPIDTREDTLQCAAALATLQLIAKETQMPAATIVRSGNRWAVMFPTVVVNAAQGTTP